jgi:hypothetical protein
MERSRPVERRAVTTDSVAQALVEQLRKEIQDLRAVIARLKNRIADLAAEHKALRDQLDDTYLAGLLPTDARAGSIAAPVG